MVRRYFGVLGCAGFVVAGAVAGCGSNGGSGASGGDDASLDSSGDESSSGVSSGGQGSTSSGSSGASMESGSGGGGQPDATMDASGNGNDSGNPGETGSPVDSGNPVDSSNPADSGADVDSGSVADSGNPADSGGAVEAGGSDASEGGSPADGGEAGPSEAGEAGPSSAGCETSLGANYVVTSQGHVFNTGGNPASSAWTAVTLAGTDGGVELDHVVSVAHSPSFACALRDDHTVWCWAEQSAASAGTTTGGQIGDGTLTWPTNAFVASEVQTAAGPTYLTGITSLTTDGENFYTRPFCAVDTGGKVWCWGPTHTSGGGGTLLINTVTSSTYYQPYAAAILNSATPTDVLTGVAQVAAGTNQICVILTSGQVKCWGSNTYGGLGTATADGGSSSDSDYPVPVVGLPSSPGATQISVGNGTVCAIVGGEVYCWGSSGYNATGTGKTPAINCSGIGHWCDPPGAPVVLETADGGIGGPLTGASHVYFGYDFGCAITTGGGLYCWGAGPTSNAVGAQPLALGGGGTASNVTLVTSYNAEDYSGVDFAEADGTYYRGTTNHSVIGCK
jgi:alpha-tubulin suppressor-like RCC1 family protein